MSKLGKPVVGFVFVLAIVYLATWFVFRSDRTTQRFANYVYRSQYNEAAEMLAPPCSMTLGADGRLTVVDRAGKATVVPAEQLPFKVGGGRTDASGEFSMTALGSSTNGILDAPAVIMYLSVDGGGVCIEHVDS